MLILSLVKTSLTLVHGSVTTKQLTDAQTNVKTSRRSYLLNTKVSSRFILLYIRDIQKLGPECTCEVTLSTFLHHISTWVYCRSVNAPDSQTDSQNCLGSPSY